MKFKIITILLLSTFIASFAENYLINGGQESQINYQMVQKVVPASGTKKLKLSYVVPVTFTSPTYNQRISQFDVNFSLQPDKRNETTDKRGNKIIQVEWDNPSMSTPINTTITIIAMNQTRLQQLQTSAPFPLSNLEKSERQYLESTEQVPSSNSRIIQKAKQLTNGSKTEFDAVQKILTWVVDHMNYVLLPKSYNAMYSFETGKGNCQNYSHLAAALMKAVGIPARIVNGVTLKQPYDISTNQGTLTMKMAQGRHSWIEVYFPDLGWVPFDPQQTALYVSNRFVRVEIGLDNEETASDGLIRWTQSRGHDDIPRFEEVIDAALPGDHVQLTATKQNWGPQKLMFYPQVQANFTKVSTPKPPPPKKVPQSDLERMNYNTPYMFGNLEYPQNIDFMSVRGPAQSTGEEGGKEMRKNFLVETAEYVTTRGNQYAQTFILKKPMKMLKTGLALHKFGGDGQLWIELYKDDGSGKPGDYIATSDYLPLANLSFAPGYRWVDFNFSDAPLLSPGRYWIAMGFTGSPIINWFYSYGKPVGPADGTRYKTLFDEGWSRSLNFEFNYRIAGYSAK